MSNKKQAFYFSNKDRKLRYGDGREIKKGETHAVDGELELCRNGLHASERVIDALKYAPDTILWLVEVENYVTGNDKLCARSRKYIDSCDIEDLLRESARKQALINIEKIKPYCSELDYELIEKWLNSGDEELRSAAESVAWSAAQSAARSAAWSAAESAAQSAARSAAWSAAESAAQSAAWSAARSAAWSAAESAAWSAAESVAQSAARSAADIMLTEMIKEKKQVGRYKEMNYSTNKQLREIEEKSVKARKIITELGIALLLGIALGIIMGMAILWWIK